MKTLRFASLVLACSLLVAAGAEPGRHVEIKDGWFYVDGEKFFVKGVCYFEAHDVEGQCVQSSPEVLDYEFGKIREAGFNTIRTFLTADKIELAAKHGLMIMQDADRLCFSDDYTNAVRLQELRANINEIVGFSKRYGNILCYGIDNEPNPRAIYRQGAKNAESMWLDLSSKVKDIQPEALTTIAMMPPDGIVHTPMCDVVSLNLYPFNPAANSIGYAAYADWYRRSHAAGKVYVISEYGWTEDPRDFGPRMMELLDKQIQAGASGSFLFTWRAWHKEKTADSNWWGIIPNNGMPNDYRNEPRPAFRDYQKYFEAVAVEPKVDGVYAGRIPLEVYGSDRTGSMEAELDGRTIPLKKQGRFWWNGEIALGPESIGERTVSISAKDTDGKVLVEKRVRVQLVAEKKTWRVEIQGPNGVLTTNEAYTADIVIVDEAGQRVPNQALVLAVTQSALNDWVSARSKGTTDTNGVFSFREEHLLPGYFTLMAGVATERKDIQLQADVAICRVNE